VTADLEWGHLGHVSDGEIIDVCHERLSCLCTCPFASRGCWVKEMMLKREHDQLYCTCQPHTRKSRHRTSLYLRAQKHHLDLNWTIRSPLVHGLLLLYRLHNPAYFVDICSRVLHSPLLHIEHPRIKISITILRPFNVMRLFNLKSSTSPSQRLQ
jgi:hypothetical protein